jgi:hypothetical protein
VICITRSIHIWSCGRGVLVFFDAPGETRGVVSRGILEESEVSIVASRDRQG